MAANTSSARSIKDIFFKLIPKFTLLPRFLGNSRILLSSGYYYTPDIYATCFKIFFLFFFSFLYSRSIFSRGITIVPRASRHCTFVSWYDWNSSSRRSIGHSTIICDHWRREFWGRGASVNPNLSSRAASVVATQTRFVWYGEARCRRVHTCARTDAGIARDGTAVSELKAEITQQYLPFTRARRRDPTFLSSSTSRESETERERERDMGGTLFLIDLCTAGLSTTSGYRSIYLYLVRKTRQVPFDS